MDWQKYFEMMIDWKKLPAYRTEPRVDSLIGFYLPDILSKYFNDTIIGIIPELPIRLGTIHEKYKNTRNANRSYKVDFYLLSKCGLNYFIEFKTDSKSRRDKQDNYLSISKEKGMKNIIEGILKISSVSSYTIKYNHLKNKLLKLNIINKNMQFIGKDDIKIVYVQPSNTKNGNCCIDFKWISNWLSSLNETESFENKLSYALKEWAKD